MVQDFDSYSADHWRHHGDDFATERDPDVQFLMRLGFRPGMDVPTLRRRFMRLRWSPWFHWTYFRHRVTSQFLNGSRARRIGVLAFWLAIVFAITWLDAWLAFLVAWVLPVVFMFQQAALEQFLGEHRWLRSSMTESAGLPKFSQVSSGRFALDAPPPESSRWLGLAWTWWGLRLIFVHARFRARVVWGDLAHHDEHHLHGLVTLHRRGLPLPHWAQPEMAWMNTAYARRLYERLRQPGDPQLTAYWDRWSPLLATFAVFASLDPAAARPATDAELRDGMLGM